MSIPQKLSTIIWELARMGFRDPQAVPSSEAAHAVLLFAHVAWNRTLGHDLSAFEELLEVYVRSNPKLWSELCSRNAEALIKMMRQAKEQRYAADRRVVVVCGIREQNVHIEWCDEQDYPLAAELAAKRLESALEPGSIIKKRQPRNGQR
jgi:hypothetical protein